MENNTTVNKNINQKRKIRSLIRKYFTDEVYIELLKITMLSKITNNDKGDMITALLDKYNIPATPLGSGTNRAAWLIEEYAVKIALDSDGMIDSRREALYTKQLQPYVVKVYECTPSGLIAVCEYVHIFSLSDFRANKESMREILADISSNFLIGDAGVTDKNYVNYGTRDNGEVCILDFAYIYNVKYGTFTCTCDDISILRYDDNYVNLTCPHCGKKYSFGDIRRRISRKAQEKEIGDIRRLSYNVTKDVEEVTIIDEFEPEKETAEKKISKKKKLRMKYKAIKKEQEETDNYDW